MTTTSDFPLPANTSDWKAKISAYGQSLDCVHCGLCLPACPTYSISGLETDSPRGRIYLMRALAENRIEDPAAIREPLDRCLGCRACETACPSGVQYGQILENVRGAMQEQEPARGLAAKLRGWLLRSVVAKPTRLRRMTSLLAVTQATGLRKLAFALRMVPRSMRELAPNIPRRAERKPIETGLHSPDQATFPDGPRGRVGLFVGCVMEQLFGRVNRNTRDLLLANNFEVFIPDTQGCCGALHLHDGHVATAKALATKNFAAFASCDIVVNNSAGCGCALRESGELLETPSAHAFAAKCRDISEFLNDVGLVATPAPRKLRVAYDPPCHLMHGQGVTDAPRNLLSQVPGLELVDFEDSDSCCGSAGIYNLVQPELARIVGDKKVDCLAKAQPELVATGNPGCAMQIAARLKAAGLNIPVVHPVELLLPPRSGPSKAL